MFAAAKAVFYEINHGKSKLHNNWRSGGLKTCGKIEKNTMHLHQIKLKKFRESYDC